jgi:hypothetical protein
LNILTFRPPSSKLSVAITNPFSWPIAQRSDRVVHLFRPSCLLSSLAFAPVARFHAIVIVLLGAPPRLLDHCFASSPPRLFPPSWQFHAPGANRNIATSSVDSIRSSQQSLAGLWRTHGLPFALTPPTFELHFTCRSPDCLQLDKRQSLLLWTFRAEFPESWQGLSRPSFPAARAILLVAPLRNSLPSGTKVYLCLRRRRSLPHTQGSQQQPRRRRRHRISRHRNVN